MSCVVTAIITARGGSKGLPHKNILPLNGMPLIGWTIQAAHAARCIHRTVLSSDDTQIIATAKHLGCEVPFVRPAKLAQDTTQTTDVLLHMLEHITTDYIVLLQPTSPLRLAQDIDNCFAQLMRDKAPSCISITESSVSPYWLYARDQAGKLTPFAQSTLASTRRQDAPPMYVPNGAIYIAHAQWFKENRSFIGKETTGYLMPKERSADIDTQIDFDLCELYMKKSPELFPAQQLA